MSQTIKSCLLLSMIFAARSAYSMEANRSITMAGIISAGNLHIQAKSIIANGTLNAKNISLKGGSIFLGSNVSIVGKNITINAKNFEIRGSLTCERECLISCAESCDGRASCRSRRPRPL